LSPSQQLHELFNGEPGIGDDPTKRARSELPVVGNDNPGVRVLATEDHVATRLAAEDKPGPLQRRADFKPG
jgi:hypothetical protein